MLFITLEKGRCPQSINIFFVCYRREDRFNWFYVHVTQKKTITNKIFIWNETIKQNLTPGLLTQPLCCKSAHRQRDGTCSSWGWVGGEPGLPGCLCSLCCRPTGLLSHAPTFLLYEPHKRSFTFPLGAWCHPSCRIISRDSRLSFWPLYLNFPFTSQRSFLGSFIYFPHFVPLPTSLVI